MSISLKLVASGINSQKKYTRNNLSSNASKFDFEANGNEAVVKFEGKYYHEEGDSEGIVEAILLY